MRRAAMSAASSAIAATIRSAWRLCRTGAGREMSMRRAWVMKLKPGNEALYKKRHDELWPEMRSLMERGNVLSFSIYRYGLLLFAYQDLRDDGASEESWSAELSGRWWASMAPLMETNSDLSPVEEPVEEMFHFEKAGR
ncbi:MAG: L-rhamnose mutarotase [Planctomycetota bacterium]